MQIDVSVVVPVYNTEKYLPQCVDSLLKQTLRNAEFIFVDDGSTDGSLDILEKYRQKDGRITVLRQNHLFAGVARNTGMGAAKGKYIIFLDSDDFFAPDMLESAFLCAEKNRTDIVVFGFNRYDAQTGVSKPFKKISALPDCVFSMEHSDQPLDERFFGRCFPAPWNKLYLRGFIEKHDLQFQPVRKCNDVYFVLMSLILAERIKYLDRRLVNYRVNNPGSSQGNRSFDRESFMESGISVKKRAAELNRYHGMVKTAFIPYAIRLVRHGTDGDIQYEDYRRYYDYVKQHLIPDLFDAPEDFAQDAMVSDFYRSRDLGEYLFLRLTDTEKSLTDTRKRLKKASASTIYRIGQALKRLPRRVKGLFH